MKFGICTSLENAPAVKAGGWDYLEPSAQDVLQGSAAHQSWHGKRQIEAAALRVYSVNLLVPASLKVTGPDAAPAQLRDYMSRIIARAASCGIRMLVFGSGGARNVPEAFNRQTAERQILSFLRESAELAGRHGVWIVVEPLHLGECNIINTVAEAMKYVRAVNHSHLGCLVDSYHFWQENEPLENVAAAVPRILHVHVADQAGRVPPGESGSGDYRPLFHALKAGGYDGNISVEADFPQALIRERGAAVLNYLKTQWLEA